MTQEDLMPLQQKIIRQVEYYFGDSNLSRDNFLKNELSKEEGWVEIETLLTFNRLKALTEDKDVIAAALKKSSSGLIEINGVGDKIKRIKPLPDYTDEYKKELRLRTLHLVGFPTDSTLDQIIEFCLQYGTVNHVQMRRFKDHSFKGCIFVVYNNVDDAKKALAGEEKFLNEHKLHLREDKEQYIVRKTNRSIKKNKGLVKLGDAKKSDENEDDLKFEPNCVLKLSNVNESMNYHEIKQAFLEHVKVEFVEINTEKLEALVRLPSNEDLTTALNKLKVEIETEKKAENEEISPNKNSNVISIGEHKLAFEILTGEEESDYWKMVRKVRSEYMKTRNSHSHKRKQRKQGFNNQKKRARVQE